jgi:hypothetical protein
MAHVKPRLTGSRLPLASCFACGYRLGSCCRRAARTRLVRLMQPFQVLAESVFPRILTSCASGVRLRRCVHARHMQSGQSTAWNGKRRIPEYESLQDNSLLCTARRM